MTYCFGAYQNVYQRFSQYHFETSQKLESVNIHLLVELQWVNFRPSNVDMSIYRQCKRTLYRRQVVKPNIINLSDQQNVKQWNVFPICVKSEQMTGGKLDMTNNRYEYSVFIFHMKNIYLYHLSVIFSDSLFFLPPDYLIF